MLANKSLTELRGIAQSFGIKDIFQKDLLQLKQAIELKQQDMQPAPKVEIAKPEYDARLMTKPPARIGNRSELEALLAPYIVRGLHARFDDECWYFSFGKKNDSGSLRMPMKTVLWCAGRVLG